MPRTARATWLWVLLAAAVYAFAGLWPKPLDWTDEIRVAEISREMAVSGNVLQLHLGGQPFLEHPPLYYAAVAAAFRLFGVSDGVARMPSALATIALLLLVFDLGRRTSGTRAGLLAAAVLACTSGLFRYGHDCLVDSWLALFVCAGYWAYARLLLAEAQIDGRRPSAILLLCVYASAALAFLVKGPIGPALIAPPVLVHAVLARRRALLLSPVHLLGVPLLLAACAAWPALLYLHGSQEAFHEWWKANVLGRIAPDEGYSGGHVQGPLFYLTAFPGLALPWFVAAPFVVRWLLRRSPTEGDAQQRACRRTYGFLVAACVVGLLLLSATGTKRGLYALPLLAPFAVLTGAWIVTLGSRPRRYVERTAWISFGLGVLVLQFGYLYPQPKRDLTPLANDLVSMQVLDDTVGFQLGERLRAIVPFRTGVILPDLLSGPALEEHCERHNGCKVLIEQRNLPLVPPETAARLRPLRQWSFEERQVGLYVLADPVAKASGGDR